MQQTCAKTGIPFEVSDEDLAFLDKLSPVIAGKKYPLPPPTLCPAARMQRRLTFRNQQTLYKRTCGMSGDVITSIYSTDKPHPVYSPEEWWGDKWDGLSFGRDFDFNRPFFDQFRELMQVVPHISGLIVNVENSAFTNQTYDCRNCYLSSAIKDCEDVVYCQNVNRMTDCTESSYCHDSELLYQCTDCYECYNLHYGKNCIQCKESRFLYDCIGCLQCFGCVGLRNKEYHYFNQPLSKEEYEKKVAEHNLHTFPGVQRTMQQWATYLKEYPRIFAWIKNCENVTGNNVRGSRNCKYCFDCLGLEDCSYSTWIFDSKDAMDCYGMGESQVIYDCVGVEEVQNIAFSLGTSNSQNCFYTDLCMHCKDCFGCSGLRRKQYCILNKQYTKEEYEELVPRIIAHMQSHGEWGEFFPPSVSAFCYNESKAMEDYPLTKEQALAEGFSWKDDIDEVPQVEKVIPADRLPDSIDDIPDDILNWAIHCSQSGRPYRITKKELEFYRAQRIPVPHIHPDIRRIERMGSRAQQSLIGRTCEQCQKQLPSVWDESIKVLCEECYVAGLY